MSANVTREKPVASPSTGLGLAGAGLAIVVAIGIGLALSEDNATSPSDAQQAWPQVTDSHRVKAEMIAERDATSPGANFGGNEASRYGAEERRIRKVKDQSQEMGTGRSRAVSSRPRGRKKGSSPDGPFFSSRGCIKA
jgi:hypothetical protein